MTGVNDVSFFATLIGVPPPARFGDPLSSAPSAEVSVPGSALTSSDVTTDGLRRRPAAGASARALLFTVLGEYLREPGRQVWTTTLVGALGALGVGEGAARQAVTRSVRAGWLRSTRHGRAMRCALTPAAREHIVESADEVYRLRRFPPAWDGMWLTLVTSVPESRRDLRHRLRTRLRWAGFGALGQGVWVSPRTASEPVARRVLDDLGLASNAVSVVGRIGGLGSEFEVVGRAWDLAALARDYSDFLGAFPPATSATNRCTLFADHTEMVHRWRGFALRDPILPAELLPARWPGHEAAGRFYSRHDAMDGAARAWLDDLDEHPAPHMRGL